MKSFIAFVSIILLVASCTDSRRSKVFGYGDKFKVELVNCDGTVTNSWISTGKVLSENNTDGYYFTDSKTGALIEVAGTLIITEIKKDLIIEDYEIITPKDTISTNMILEQ